MERLTYKDRALLRIAFETKNISDLAKLISETDTELAKRAIANYMRMYKNLLE